MSTLQEQFDKIAKHLLTQNARSVGVRDNCAYRGLNGMKCAAGCMIPDEEYTTKMEGKAWNTVCMLRPKLAKLLDSRLGRALQGVHDGYPPEEWPERLRIVAEQFGLQYNEELYHS